MIKKTNLMLMALLCITFFSCTAKKKIVTDDFVTEATDSTTAAEPSIDDALNDEMTFDDDSSSQVASDSSTESSSDSEAELTLDEPSTEKSVKADKPSSPETAEVALDKELELATNDNKAAVAASPPPPVEVPPSPPQPVVIESTPEPAVPPPVEVSVPRKKIAHIKDVQFKSNDSGGALMISADQPVEYTTRLNSATNQMVIEVQNVQVPQKFKRPLNTKDMSSSMAHIDIYQKPKSNVARFVVQLRAEADQPLIQPEGTSLLVIGSLQNVRSTLAAQKSGLKESVAAIETNEDFANESIMNTTDMDEYLANNTKFYGKKISIETTDMNIKDVLKFISEESGVNMIFDDAIGGNISLKLRKVPWDQAFVLVLKSKGLSYRRQGSVLRVATNETLVKEEKTALELKDAKKLVEPLVVKNFSINYADISQLEQKLKDYIASDEMGGKTKGRITSDKRTNMMIVTETPTKLKQIEALVRALDTQPQQVMIEARVIEASESFNKAIGADWGLNRGKAFGNSPRTATGLEPKPWSDPLPIRVSPSLSYTAPQVANASFGSSLWFGKLGALGDLDVQLALEQSEDKIKILSSPRVTVLTNTQATITQSFKLASGTTSVTTNNVTVSEPKFVDVGVKLNVTPQISNLGTVRMMIDVIRTGLQPGGSTNSRDMKTEVIVKSGDTTVIGGVFQSDTAIGKNGVPGLKDIPILGTLFRGEKNSNSKTELMVFVTPKILPPVVPAVNMADAEVDTAVKISE